MKIKTKVKAGSRCGDAGNDIQSASRFLCCAARASLELLVSFSRLQEMHMKIQTKVKAGGRCGAGLDI